MCRIGCDLFNKYADLAKFLELLRFLLLRNLSLTALRRSDVSMKSA